MVIAANVLSRIKTMKYHNHFRRLTRGAVLLIISGCLLLASSGCVTLRSMQQKKKSGQPCQCASCQARRSAATISNRHTAGKPTASYDTTVPYGSGPSAGNLTVPPSASPGPMPVPPEMSPPEISGLDATPPPTAAEDQEARRTCDALRRESEDMREQLQRLENQVVQARTSRDGLEKSMMGMQSQVAELSSELDYWKDEVRRIDEVAARNHRDDMRSLQAISELISQLPDPDSMASRPGNTRL